MNFFTSDYIWSGSKTLRFDAGGSQELSVTLSIVDNIEIERQETLIISLTNPQPSDAVEVLGSTTVIITNNDFRMLLLQNTRPVFKLCALKFIILYLFSSSHWV